MSSTDRTLLTEDILQKLYKSKTYLRNEEWDVIWYLGGKNNVTIGEKDSRFFLLPNKQTGVVVDVLPFELIQGEHANDSEAQILLETVSDLQRVFPELNSILGLID